MSDITGGKDGEGNISGDIERESDSERQGERIFRSWVEGNSPGWIAKDVGLPVDIVYRRLKRLQKERIAEQGGGNYGKRSEF
jgi:hypothetical protein